MMLHAGVLNVILKSGFQLSDFLLSIGIAVIPVSFVGHLDVFQAMLGCNLLVFCGETHASALTGGHCDGWWSEAWGSRLLHADACCFFTAAPLVSAGGKSSVQN